MRTDVTVGARFPDYELPDHTGRPQRLSELQGDDPMIIVLAREAYPLWSRLSVCERPDRPVGQPQKELVVNLAW